MKCQEFSSKNEVNRLDMEMKCLFRHRGTSGIST
jgi:hypothetical protein